jgi:hypothetical protein
MQALRREAENWHSAQILRAYVSSLDSGESRGAAAAWLAWARRVADQLDPTERRVQELKSAERPGTRTDDASK